MAREELPEMIDLKTADAVDVSVDEFGKLWLNIDGKCVIRIGHVKERVFYDAPGFAHTVKISNGV